MPADQRSPQNRANRGTFHHDIKEIEASPKRHPHCSILFWYMRSAPLVLRSALVGLVATFALFAPGSASAQYGTGGTIGYGTGGITGSTTLAATDFTILFEGYFNGQWVQMNSTTQQYYFNQARCLCDTDPNGEFQVIVQPASGAGAKIQTAARKQPDGRGARRIVPIRERPGFRLS